MRKRKIWFVIPLLLIIGYLMGPKPATPVYDTRMPEVPGRADSLVQYIKQREARHKLKPDNEARIVWFNDSLRQPTEYAFVYLHGFSASQEEGDPVHRHAAKLFGCNLYLSRLAEHGIDTVDALRNLTADEYWESAKEALAIGKKIGRKVILMSTSTGGTNALQLAATYPADVYALVMLSPNIAINDPNAWVLNNPWGLQIATLVTGSRTMQSSDRRPVYRQYWYGKYRLEGAVALQEMLETTMTPATFARVKQPCLMLYYYRDEVHQDSVVSVPAMLKMFDELGTDPALRVKRAMPNAGNHVLGSPIKSKDAPGVERAVDSFLVQQLHLQPVGSQPLGMQ